LSISAKGWIRLACSSVAWFKVKLVVVLKKVQLRLGGEEEIERKDRKM
jgi:hypothetical protein